jgi:hypothetical protein
MKRKYWSQSIQRQFFEAFETSGNVSAACRAIGFSRTAVYQRRKREQAFAIAWDEAEQVAADAIEAEMWRRGVDGIGRPIHYQGNVVGTIKEYSDQLLIQLAKARRPEKFNERLQVESMGSGNLVVEHVISLKRQEEKVIEHDEGG